jgi:preprotein translocase subunit SecF
MNVFQRAYRGEIRIDFVGLRRRWFTFSAAIIAVSILAMLLRGFNFGIEFEGGALVEVVENPAQATVTEVRDAVEGIGLEGAKVQAVNSGSGMRVQTGELALDQEDELIAILAEVTGVEIGDVSLKSVGPTFGSRVAESAIRALVIFLIVVAFYISWRLEWKMAIAALVALVHDLLFTAGIYSLIGFEVDHRERRGAW